MKQIIDIKMGSKSMNIKKWLRNNALLIGSRALGVESKYSDYDYAVSKSVLDNIDIESADGYVALVSAKAYFNVLPLGNTMLVKLSFGSGIMCDIIVFENEEEVDALKRSMEIMKKVPKEILEHKYLRVLIFEQLLSTEWN